MTRQVTAPVLASSRFSRLALALLATAALATAAWAQDSPTASSYRLGPKDRVRIKVFEVPELNVDGRITETGTIILPLIGEVPAAGLTDRELAAKLKELLESKYVNHATVSVEVLEMRSRPISVIGAVQRPGALDFPGRWTLLDALAAAGGLAADHGDVIYVLRRAQNGLSDQLSIRVDDLMEKGLPEANIPINANDLINVPARVQISIYCLGQVGSPGAQTFQSTDRVTLLAVLSRAGGLTDRASKKILIRHRQGDSLTGETVVDYKRLLAGKEPDPVLHAGDVVIVKESFF